MTVFEQFKQVKAFAFDVDGVFTNGTVFVTEQGEQLRTFHVRDGYALQFAIKQKYPVLIVSGGNSHSVALRFKYLGVSDVFIDVADKGAVLTAWKERNNLEAEDILFMGDDMPDLAVMKTIGFPTCPADAIEDIKGICTYISPFAGGNGAVRDVIEKVLRLQGKWGSNTGLKST